MIVCVESRLCRALILKKGRPAVFVLFPIIGFVWVFCKFDLQNVICANFYVHIRVQRVKIRTYM